MIDWIRIGEWCLELAFLGACTGVLIAASGVYRRDHRYVRSSAGMLYGVTFLIGIASACLVHGFLTNDYSVSYIASYSERALELPYKIAGLWAGPTGSLLFWCLLLSVLSSLAVFGERRNTRDRFVAPMIAVLLGVLSFFLLLITTDSLEFNPFARIEGWQPGVSAPDGRGLNPQLHNYWMLIHPVCLYLGYTGLTIPFAYAMGVLIAGERGDAWLRRMRFWTILPWTFLTVGIVLGGVWAYEELGWGGYWAWDPVENASFLPWLTATAFVHSIMIQERRGMFRRWNMILIILTFTLSTLGTYITRGDVVPTVHNFGASKVQEPYQWFLGFVVGWGLLLVIYRWDRLKGDHKLEDFLSREGGFLFNNVAFLFLAVLVLYGTLHPRLDEVGTNSSLYPAFNTVIDAVNNATDAGWSRFPQGNEKTVWKVAHYNRWTPPVFVFLLLLTGIGPLLAWRKSSARSLWRNLLWPGLAFMIGFAGFAVWTLARDKGAPGPETALDWTLMALVVAGSALCLASIIQEFVRGTRARMKQKQETWPKALLLVTLFNKRRYGGYIVHLGMVLIFLGVGFSWNYRYENRQTAVALGGDFMTGPYHMRLDEIRHAVVGRSWSDEDAGSADLVLVLPWLCLSAGLLGAALLSRPKRPRMAGLGALLLAGAGVVGLSDGMSAATAADKSEAPGTEEPSREPHYEATRFVLRVRLHDAVAWSRIQALTAPLPLHMERAEALKRATNLRVREWATNLDTPLRQSFAAMTERAENESFAFTGEAKRAETRLRELLADPPDDETRALSAELTRLLDEWPKILQTREAAAKDYWAAHEARLVTEWRRYLQYKQNSGEPTSTSEPAVRRGFGYLGDLYIYAPNFTAGDGKYIFHSFVNPMINWIWVGTAVLLGGMLVCLIPDPSRRVGLKGG